MQLEKIRQSEKELRWQYEEDVDNCAECRQLFSVTKRKVTLLVYSSLSCFQLSLHILLFFRILQHHCRHCGQIYCFDCLRKSVTSGPNKRLARVCNVCYYLLVQDSAPFFSLEQQSQPNV